MLRKDFDESLISLGDIIVLLIIIAFAVLAVHGSTVISSGGAIIDSDLATYAQGMAGADHPEMFEADPVLHNRSAANSIWNLERCLASWLTPDENYAVGLLRVGGLIIFWYYFSWYVFGRWLFRRRVYGLLLMILVSITVWVGFGTFWGIAHSDPLPRAFHAAFFPWMLMLAIMGYNESMFRPIAMLAAGLSMWIHGVSALNTGAMFFMAFLVHKPKDVFFSQYLANLFISVLAFLLPVILFLWPSLGQARNFSQEELSLFQEFFRTRWQEDYGDILGTLATLFSLENPTSYIIYGGAVAIGFGMISENERLRSFARMAPGFIVGICGVFIFSYLETKYAANWGRLFMGHELVRGVKFFIPLAWIGICGLLALCLSHLSKAISWACVLAATVLVISLSQDKQYISVQYTLSELTGLHLPLYQKAKNMKAESEQAREAIEKVQELVPVGEPVFCLDDRMMALRYLGLHPLAYLFKDGFVFFYNKDFEECKKWLKYTKEITTELQNLPQILKSNKVRYVLLNEVNAIQGNLVMLHKVLWKNDKWILIDYEK